MRSETPRLAGMGKTYERIDGRLREFIDRQPVFFVATAPLGADGHVNLSPKGRSGTLVVLDELTLAYLDFGGSTAETLAHLRENGRITLMWCAFDGPPTVVRVHGQGEAVFRDDPRFAELLGRFDPAADGSALRAIVLVRAERVSDSCGFAVPFMDYRGERELHEQYFDRKTDEEFNTYCEGKPYIATSIDGLPALPLPLPPRPERAGAAGGTAG
ncbi:pyridoxamine 5'-phosphate oxidase family protein [Kitasatospora terrestris]|uniref:Pyridoxamine 5'-phosphate oxidase family protein n=2 Tax=Kitasatospora terrestris TaxID=258051 RepID=A0ABP9DYN7_9ACTN